MQAPEMRLSSQDAAEFGEGEGRILAAHSKQGGST
jgi:hypothetical protein